LIRDRVKASPNLLGRFKNFSGNEYRFIQAGFKPPYLFITAGHDVRTNTNIPATYEAKLTKLDDKSKEELFRSNKYFWWALGLDQSVHHLTHYLIIFFMV